jgi:hypothetical protein
MVEFLGGGEIQSNSMSRKICYTVKTLVVQANSSQCIVKIQTFHWGS